jgi:putative oxidoreductase
MTISKKIHSADFFLIRLGRRFSPYFLLAIRLFWGALFFYAGLESYANFDDIQELLTGLHFPIPHVMTAILVGIEITAGLFVMAGFLTSIAALVIILTMVIALFTASLAATQNIMIDPYQFSSERPIGYLMVALVLFSFGPGKFSFDKFIIELLNNNRNSKDI